MGVLILLNEVISMATIRTVVENYTGIRAGITFVNGIGETNNPHLIDWFKNHGYIAEDTEDKEEAQEKPKRKSKSKE